MQSCGSGKLSESEFTELLNLQNTYWHKEKTMRYERRSIFILKILKLWEL